MAFQLHFEILRAWYAHSMLTFSIKVLYANSVKVILVVLPHTVVLGHGFQHVFVHRQSLVFRRSERPTQQPHHNGYTCHCSSCHDHLPNRNRIIPNFLKNRFVHITFSFSWAFSHKARSFFAFGQKKRAYDFS